MLAMNLSRALPALLVLSPDPPVQLSLSGAERTNQVPF